MLRLLPALLVALLLAGCATYGMTYAQLQTKLTPPGEGQGRIYIYRTRVPQIVANYTAAMQPSVKLNDVVVGLAVPRGFIYLDRPAGDYTISITTEVTRTLSLTLAPGQVRFVRLDGSMGFFIGHVFPVLVPNSEGEAGIADCHIIGS